MITNTCDLCGAENNYSIIWSKTEREKQGLLRSVVIRDKSNNILHGDICICLRCGLVYVLDKMSKEELDRFYAEDYRKIYGNEKPDIQSEERHAGTAHRIIHTAIFKTFESYDKYRSFLDIGCSTGQLLIWWALNSGRDRIIEGVEKSQYKPADYKVYNDITEVQNNYDIVTMLNTLEHVYSPTETLQQIHKLLNNDGYLLISVPDIYNTNIRIPMDAYLSNAHLYNFSPHTLGLMLSKCGFKIVKMLFVPEEMGDKMYVLAKKDEPIETIWNVKIDPELMQYFLRCNDDIYAIKQILLNGGSL